MKWGAKQVSTLKPPLHHSLFPILTAIPFLAHDESCQDTFWVRHNRSLIAVCFRLCSKEGLTVGQLMSSHLEQSYKMKKWLQEPIQKPGSVRTLLIDNYDSYTYNVYQELSVVNGVPPVVIRNDDWTWEELYYYMYEEKAFDNIVISPGPGSPACPTDIGICLQLLLNCWDIPVLGVCLGHQALGFVHGAQVVHAPEPIHGRLSEVEHNGCQLFHDIPAGGQSGFKVVRYHSLVIDHESLPEELIPIAWTSASAKVGNSKLSSHIEKSRQGKVLMGIKHSARPHYGLQFHPESIGTYHGRQIFKNFREITKDYWLRVRSSYNREKYNHSAGFKC
ncbi:hypothetical protein L6164_007248 [Bauhinia variegata]|uniref:Uncharacterized protein n=1 Tax=Bauhinia variegata TaxID=167791 RepID=A0ACB9PC95_BAUVA|nr:hypothetical protein L6164_007248 [Bauhinia variegata]